MTWDKLVRGDSIYLSAEVHRALRIIAKAASGGLNGKVTKDQTADELLRKVIAQDYPQLAEHQSNIEKIEEQMMESIRSTPAHE